MVNYVKTFAVGGRPNEVGHTAEYGLETDRVADAIGSTKQLNTFAEGVQPRPRTPGADEGILSRFERKNGGGVVNSKRMIPCRASHASYLDCDYLKQSSSNSAI